VASDDLAEDPHAAITGYLEVPDIAGESRPAPTGDGTTEHFFTVQIAEARNDPSDDGSSTPGESAGDGGGVPALRQESLNNKYAENMPDDAPSDGTSNTLLASESPPAPDAGEETYLQVTLENAQITSYQLGGADDGPSTLAELGDTSETGEAVVQHGQTDLSFLLEHADDLPAGDELEEPEL
jgi:hypothetical protein